MAVADLHVLIALQNGWGPYAEPTNGPTHFARLFPAVQPELVGEWWTDLMVTNPVSFRANAAPGSDGLPVIIVQMMGERVVEEALGHFGRKWTEVDKRLDVDSFIVETDVQVGMFAKSAEIARAMFVLTRAILLRFSKEFIKTGYLSFEYVSAQELAPEEELAAQELGVYVRRQTFKARSQIEAFPVDLVVSEKPWWLQVRGPEPGGLASTLDPFKTTLNPTGQPPPVDTSVTDPNTGLVIPSQRVEDVDGDAGTVVPST